jgi:hypothetical protein
MKNKPRRAAEEFLDRIYKMNRMGAGENGIRPA